MHAFRAQQRYPGKQELHGSGSGPRADRLPLRIQRYPLQDAAFLTFNDTYSIYDPNGQKVVINEKNLDQ
jgi:hypothetical protein